MIRTIIDTNTAIIHIEKNIISENVELLETKISEAKSDSIINFIFDFHNTEYLCSAALGVIAQILRVTSEDSGKVIFCSMTVKLKELFIATKFLSVVDSADSLSDAMDMVK